MPSLKNELDHAAAGRLASELALAWPDFPRRRFLRGLSDALDPLELLARGDLLSDRLVANLPTEFGDAVSVLRRALDSATFTGWIVLPCGGFVARAGLDEPDTALPLLAELTSRWSSEFAIRPFIASHPERTYRYLHDWLHHDDEHVRRLVSEGTRPRLPWASRLRALVEDPTSNIALLDALVSDPSAYVRRSVANHLNDITKDHPDVALDLATRWVSRGEPAAGVVRHGLRTLVKHGERRALDLVGVGDEDLELTDLGVDRPRIGIGEDVELTLTLALPTTAPAATDVIVDYRVHFVGARGTPKAPKVFKLTRRRLAPGQPVTIRRRHRFDHASIREIHPGRHQIDVQVNGRVLGSVHVDVAATADGRPPR